MTVTGIGARRIVTLPALTGNLKLPGDWTERAECRGWPTNIFFPERNDAGGVPLARRICATCPVRTECLRWALDNDEQFGIWGGTSQRERRRIRRTETAA